MEIRDITKALRERPCRTGRLLFSLCNSRLQCRCHGCFGIGSVKEARKTNVLLKESLNLESIPNPLGSGLRL